VHVIPWLIAQIKHAPPEGWSNYFGKRVYPPPDGRASAGKQPASVAEGKKKETDLEHTTSNASARAGGCLPAKPG